MEAIPIRKRTDHSSILSINEVTVIRGVFDALDREAIRVIKEMPQWNPGLQNGQAVRVYYTIPIRFELR